MKRILTLFAAVGLLQLAATAGEAKWHTDIDKALEKAQKEDKSVLINFTGSDWCGFCKLLEKEVYSTEEWQKYAEKNLVLVVADFPRQKDLSAKQKKANEQLKEKYASPFGGYPTTVILDAKGKKLGEKVGYPPGSGTSAFIKEVSKITKS